MNLNASPKHVPYRFRLPKLNANGMQFSPEFAIAYGFCALLAYTLFRSFGIFALVLCSAFASVYYSKDTEISWPEFWNLAIAFLILLIVGNIAAVIALSILEIVGLLNFIFASTLVELPIDQMTLEMLDRNGVVPPEYSKILGRSFWQLYLPAANFTILVGSVGFGICLSLLTTNRVCAYHKLGDWRSKLTVMISLVVLLCMILAAQLLSYFIIPLSHSTVMSTLTIAPFTWSVFLLFAVLFHALIHNYME